MLKLKNVRISTMAASTPTLVKVGETATVRMVAPATRNSEPKVESPGLFPGGSYRTVSDLCPYTGARGKRTVATTMPSTTAATPHTLDCLAHQADDAFETHSHSDLHSAVPLRGAMTLSSPDCCSRDCG
jgi:hypothetical protein